MARLSPTEKARRAFERAEAARKKAGLRAPRRGPEAYARRKVREQALSGRTPYQRQKAVSAARYKVRTPKAATRIIKFDRLIRDPYLRITGQTRGSDLDDWILENRATAEKAYEKVLAQAEIRASGHRLTTAQWAAEWEGEEFEDMPSEGSNYHGSESA